jgi:hypothetical protein
VVLVNSIEGDFLRCSLVPVLLLPHTILSEKVNGPSKASHSDYELVNSIEGGHSALFAGTSFTIASYHNIRKSKWL